MGWREGGRRGWREGGSEEGMVFLRSSDCIVQAGPWIRKSTDNAYNKHHIIDWIESKFYR